MRKVLWVLLVFLLSNVYAKEKKITIVNFVLDETGSMDTVRDTTISGFNEYVNTLKKRKEKILFSLIQFNSEKMETVYTVVEIDMIEELTRSVYVPDNMTPLYDAIVKSIKDTEERIIKFSTKCKCCGQLIKPNVLCVIVTDGLENASKEYTRDDVFRMIKEKEEENWTFAYLGANQDAWVVGQSIGFIQGNVITFDTNNMKGTFQNIIDCTVNYLDAGSIQTETFFKIEEGEKK